MKNKNSISTVERINRILEIIEEKKSITIETICNECNVSQATGRRDLDKLHKEGIITRVHGGAIALKKSHPESPLFQRMEIQTENKKRIGAAMAALIQNGETVFLGSGTTVYEVAKYLRDRQELTVITNSLLVINELITNSTITLVALGGIMRHSEQSMIGGIAEESLAGLYVDKVIIGIHGIDIEQGLTNHDLPEAITDRKILEAGKRVFIVADHTKLGAVSVSKVAPITIVDTIVTDTSIPRELITEIERLGIRIEIA